MFSCIPNGMHRPVKNISILRLSRIPEGCAPVLALFGGASVGFAAINTVRMQKNRKNIRITNENSLRLPGNRRRVLL